MTGKSGVVELLDALLILELTLHEGAKAWRAVFAAHGYKKLYKFMDELNAESGDRRRYLEKRVVSLGGTIRLSMKDNRIDPMMSIESVLKDSYAFLGEMYKRYEDAIEQVINARDRVTGHKLVEHLCEVEHSILKCERYFRQIADMDAKLFTLSTIKG